MIIIGQKAFNDDMGKYLERVRKKETPQKKFFSKVLPEKVPDMDDGQVHIEYEKPSGLRKLFSWRRREKIKEEDDELTPQEKAKLTKMENRIEEIEDKESELEDMEEELEHERQSLLSKLFSTLGIYKKKHHGDDSFDESEIVEEKQELEEDVKEVLKIAHTWLEQLTPRYKKQFKASSDFQKYKDILVKYGLAKEKDAPVKNKN